MPAEVWAHAVTEGDKGYIQEISGVNIKPFTLSLIHISEPTRPY